LRVLDFFALLVLTARFGPYLAARVRFPWLETLGRASLPVFCAHLVIVLMVLAVLGDRLGAAPLWAETALVIAALAGMYVVAIISNRMDREQRAQAGPQPVNARTAG
jgi:peptidoglycan/LPS O-acetylase OafA/YrhL